MASLDELMNQSSQYQTLAANNSATVMSNDTKEKDVSAILRQHIAETSSAEQTVNTVEMQAKLREQTTNLAIAKQNGTDFNQTGYQLGQYGAIIKQSGLDKQAALNSIAEKRKVDFIDNPLGYLVAQIGINSDIEAFNTADGKGAAAKSTSDMLMEQSTKEFQQQATLKQTVNQASIDASNVVLGFKYQKLAAESLINSLRSNTANVTAANGLSKSALEVGFQANGAQNAAKSLALQASSQALAQQRFNLEKQSFEEKMSTDNFAVKILNAGAISLDGVAFPDDLRAKEALTLLKSNNPRMLSLYQAGVASYLAAPDGSKPMIGNSPAATAGLVSEGYVKFATPAMKDVGDWLTGAKQEFNNPAAQNAGMLQGKKPEQLVEMFNEVTRRKATLAAENGGGAVNSGTKVDIYNPAGLALTGQSNPAVAQMPVYRDVIAPLLATGVKIDTNPALVLGAVNAAIAKGTLSYNDALDLPNVMAASINLNNQLRNFTAMGMPVGTGYKVNGVDIANKKEYTRYLNKALDFGNYGVSPNP